MSQEQRRSRPDTPVILGDMVSAMLKKMEEIINIQDLLSKTQEETLRKQEELSNRKLELELRERRLALKEEEIRRSLGDNMPGFRGFERSDLSVDSFVPLPFTPGSPRAVSPRPISPAPAPRRRTLTPDFDSEGELRREIEDLWREIRNMKRIASFAPPSYLSNSSLELQEYIEHVPNFDGYNISVTQFSRACRRALDSLPAGYSLEVEASLTRLLLLKLSGHAYLVTESLKIDRVEHLIERLKDAFLPSRGPNYFRGQLFTEYMRPGERALDYFVRVRELTQLVLDETAKESGRLERGMEITIEREGLDAFIKGLPRDYKKALRFERYNNFNEVLICLFKIDKQIKEEDGKLGTSIIRSRVANVRPINNSINCNYCKRDGHLESNCWQKKGFPFPSKSEQRSPSKPGSPTKFRSPSKKKTPLATVN
ncbi:uncharacterized protein LOC122521802 [Polistes fuscatus]|uniref:uncharacterized protein LOC122521802 n=1 Tax=Polistes fuscatus TaxID=30207 RepID=UPI001CA91816|nr:uncharacterized protein LOC122521802 [Polistes fuscatus]